MEAGIDIFPDFDAFCYVNGNHKHIKKSLYFCEPFKYRMLRKTLANGKAPVLQYGADIKFV